MVIRLALIEPEPVIFESSDRHSGPVCSLDPHSESSTTKHSSSRIPEYPLYSGRSRIRFALFKLLSTDDQVKFRAHAHLLHDPRDQLRTCGGTSATV